MRIVGNNPQLSRQTQGTASGAITGGKPVLVNTDGTVSAVAETSVTEGVGTPVVLYNSSDLSSLTFDSNSNKVVIAYRDNGNANYGTAAVGTVDPSDNSITFGTPVVFNSAYSWHISDTFDSNSNKVVIAYHDDGNSSYGTAIVGTVSGTSISFGTAVVFESATTDLISAIFDSNSNKIVIAYKDDTNSGYGTAIVGTVSGTSISFGSATVFNSASTADISAAFDSNSNKVIIGYADNGNSIYGTAIVGTVSSTSISFGSETVFESANTQQISATFDSNSNKVVIAYRDNGNSGYGTAIVGTVSSTSISFGSATVFESADSRDIATTFDSNANKVVIAYRDNGNSDYGTVVTGTVSDTSISFGSPSVLDGGVEALYMRTTFDSNSNKAVIEYRDGSNGNKGTAVVFQVGYTSTNLTSSENFIGFAEDTVATGQPVTINTKGAIDENQSSLTSAQQYFVQTDGTLGTSADDPSVVAGTAVTATKLIVKG